MGTSEANGGGSAHAIVIGAGPAGSTTALLLARQGVRVLLLDRATFPRPKPCGDCLSAAATELLRRHDLLEPVLDAGAATIEGWRIVAPDGTIATGLFSDTPSLGLERRRLDPVLLRAATDAGASLRQAHVTDLVYTDGRVDGVTARLPDGSARRFNARLVVGADGLRSIVARRLDRVRRRPRLRKVSLTAHLSARDRLRHGEMHVLADGCIGYAPAGVDTRNLTVVVDASSARLAERGRAGVLRARLAAAPRMAPRLRAELSGVDELRDDDILASGPFDWPSRGPVARGAALVGDAAGYYDPFTGQGIFQAMAGAELLAAAVGPVLTQSSPCHDELDRALERYARQKRRLTRPARRVQWGIEQVLSRAWLADFALARLARAPAAMQRLVEVTGDLQPPRSLLSPVVASSFLFPPPGGTLDSSR
jgi:flavin-dependent dehydrogenase